MWGEALVHWHRSNFNDLSQRSLCILLQSDTQALHLTALSRLLYKSPEITRLAMRPWEQQGILSKTMDEQAGEPLYTLNTRYLGEVTRCVTRALFDHAALGELYFAYGSNLNPARLEARGIVPRFVARAHAQGYTIGFPRRMRDGGGVAGMLPAPNGIVEGVIYLLTDTEFALLDQYEEAPRSYFRTPRIVQVAAAPTARPLVRRLCTTTYEAVPGVPAAPTEDYLAHMITGARHWGLSSKTVNDLESIQPLTPLQSGSRRLHPARSTRRRIGRKRRAKRRR